MSFVYRAPDCQNGRHLHFNYRINRRPNYNGFVGPRGDRCVGVMLVDGVQTTAFNFRASASPNRVPKSHFRPLGTDFGTYSRLFIIDALKTYLRKKIKR